MDKIEQVYLYNLNDFHEDDEVEQNIEQDELEMTDPIFEIIEEVGEKYKKTWEKLAE